MNEENKDALNNLIASIQEKMGNDNPSTSDNTANTSPDFSSLLNTLNKKDNSNENEKTSNNNDDSGFNIDPSIFLKIQKIMSAMNSNTPQKDLLMSLKPFLRKSRQDKMSDYLTILSVISIIESFSNKGSEQYVLS